MCGSDHLDHVYVNVVLSNVVERSGGRWPQNLDGSFVRRCVSRETLRRPCHVNGPSFVDLDGLGQVLKTLRVPKEK